MATPAFNRHILLTHVLKAGSILFPVNLAGHIFKGFIFLAHVASSHVEQHAKTRFFIPAIHAFKLTVMVSQIHVCSHSKITFGNTVNQAAQKHPVFSV